MITIHVTSPSLYVYGCMGGFACMYIYVLCSYPGHEGQKKASDSLGLELSVIVNHHVAAWNQTQDSQCS